MPFTDFLKATVLTSAGAATALAAVQPVIEARTGTREAQIAATRKALLGLFDRVASLDDDRILRSFVGVIDATLRTSYYIQYKEGLAVPAEVRVFTRRPDELATLLA